MKDWLRITWLVSVLWSGIGGEGQLQAYTGRDSLRAACLNHCIDYINLQNEWLWLLHKDLETLNQALFQTGEIPLEVRHLLQRQPGEGLPEQPEARYAQIRHEARAFDEAEQQALLAEVEAVAQLMARVGSWSDQLALHLRREEGVWNEAFVWRALDQLALLYDDFVGVKGQLYFLVESLDARQPAPGRGEAYFVISHELRPLVGTSRDMLRAVRHRDHQSLAQLQRRLDRQLMQARDNEAHLLASLPAQPGSQRDPSLRYQQVLAQAMELLVYSVEYLGEAATPAPFQLWGTAYYYYNHRYLNKFSRRGETLVHQFNLLLDLSRQPLLHEMGETNWLQPVRPQQVALRTAPLPAAAARHIVLLVDVSGSMDRPDKLPLFRAQLPALLTSLGPQDRLSLISYADESKALAEVSADTAGLRRSVAALRTGGASLPAAGIGRAYDLARTHARDFDRSQIVLITDGGFRAEASFLRTIEAGAYEGIGLSVLYFGSDEVNMKARLTRLAEIGRGSYAHADKAATALRAACLVQERRAF
ncbi:MAG: hypothetical protein OHK0039_03400 [Bacteroidia bacterium]